ncbi:MAG: PepSY domain-containing protein, partial [Alphaproteobacteria bacterium]
MDGSDTQAGGGQAAPVTEQGARSRGRRTLRWLLGEIHLWAGLVLFLPLVLLGLSGSYLVYHDEIDGLLSGQR